MLAQSSPKSSNALNVLGQCGIEDDRIDDNQYICVLNSALRWRVVLPLQKIRSYQHGFGKYVSSYRVLREG